MEVIINSKEADFFFEYIEQGMPNSLDDDLKPSLFNALYGEERQNFEIWVSENENEELKEGYKVELLDDEDEDSEVQFKLRAIGTDKYLNKRTKQAKRAIKDTEMREDYLAQAKELPRSLYLMQEVSFESTKDLITAIHDINHIDDLAGIPSEEREPIKLFINSGGGCVASGFSLIQCMNASKTPVDTVALGWVASMALPIYLAGKTRYCGPFAEFMFHQLATSTAGFLRNLEDDVEHCRRTQDIVNDYLLSKCNIPASLIESVMLERKDKWFDAIEAFKWGVAQKEYSQW